MIKIEKTEVIGWESAIRGMRNPMNSWDMSDSYFCEKCVKKSVNCSECPIDADGRDVDKHYSNGCYVIGENDLVLMERLSKAGTDHRKFLRMIAVYVDLTAPLYWWKEFDTYKVGTVANSCSTMHKIHSKPIELSDFSIDDFYLGDDIGLDLKDMFINVVADCEELRKAYLIADKNAKNEDSFTEAERKHFRSQAKRFWKGLIQLLPTSYNQKRTVMLNYEVLANIYKSRKNHKLDEWVDFCKWIESLPYSVLITGKG